MQLVKIMVTGATVTATFAGQVRTDAYTPDAVSAVDAARNPVGA